MSEIAAQPVAASLQAEPPKTGAKPRKQRQTVGYGPMTRALLLGVALAFLAVMLIAPTSIVPPDLVEALRAAPGIISVTTLTA